MTKIIYRHKMFVALTASFTSLLVCVELWSASAALRGEIAARHDTARDRYEVLGYGLPVPWQQEYARLLRERYGISFRPVARRIVSEHVVAYADSYNRVSLAAATHKFGHNVFRECAEEAEKNWEVNRRARESTPRLISNSQHEQR